MARRNTVVLCLCALMSLASAYNPSRPFAKYAFSKPTNDIAKAAASAALGLLLATSEPSLAAASDVAAQVQVKTFPPSSLQINAKELPAVGSILSGTYMKVDNPVPDPSITVALPKDKIGALKSVATRGHLEVDVGGLVGTHLDVDVAAEEAGVARVRVASPLIPTLPFKNAATTGFTASGKDSDWYVLTNMGSGESYYYNQKTDEATYQKPKSF